jgi:hypothetical protein
MLVATLVGCFFTPVFYVIFQRLSEWRSPPARESAAEPAPGAAD